MEKFEIVSVVVVSEAEVETQTQNAVNERAFLRSFFSAFHF